MIIFAKKVEELNPGYVGQFMVDPADEGHVHKHYKVEFRTPGLKVEATSKARVETLGTGLKQIIEDLWDIFVDVLGLTVGAPYVLGKQGLQAYKDSAKDVVDKSIDIGKQIYFIVTSADSQTLDETFRVPITELDTTCTAGYWAKADVHGDFQTQDDSGELAECKAELTWNGVGPGTAEYTINGVKRHQAADVIPSLTGLSGEKAYALVELKVSLKAESDGDVKAKVPPVSFARIDKVTFQFDYTC